MIGQLQQHAQTGQVGVGLGGVQHDGQAHRSQLRHIGEGGDVHILAHAGHPQEDGLLVVQRGGPGHHAAVRLGDVALRIGDAGLVMVAEGAGAALPDGGAQGGHVHGGAQIVAALVHAVPHGDDGDAALFLPGKHGIVAAHAVGLDVQGLHRAEDGGTVRRGKGVGGEGHGSAQQQRTGAQAHAEGFCYVYRLGCRAEPGALADEGCVDGDGLAQGVLGAGRALIDCPEGVVPMQQIQREHRVDKEQRGQHQPEQVQRPRQQQEQRIGCRVEPFAAALQGCVAPAGQLVGFQFHGVPPGHWEMRAGL